MLAVVGVVNVPIVHFSVIWWNSLHQGSSLSLTGKDTIATPMLIPLLLSMLGFTLYFVAVVLVRLRGEVLRRERTASWVGEVVAT